MLALARLSVHVVAICWQGNLSDEKLWIFFFELHTSFPQDRDSGTVLKKLTAVMKIKRLRARKQCHQADNHVLLTADVYITQCSLA